MVLEDKGMSNEFAQKNKKKIDINWHLTSASTSGKWFLISFSLFENVQSMHDYKCFCHI